MWSHPPVAHAIHTVIITWAMQNCKRPHHLSKQSSKIETTETIPLRQNYSRSFRFPAPCWCISSSVQPLVFYRVQVRELVWSWQKLVLSKPFFCVDFDVCFVLKEDPVIFHYKISSRGSQVFIYLFIFICFDKIPWWHLSAKTLFLLPDHRYWSCLKFQ